MEVDQILGRIERVAILRITLDRIRHSNHAHARRPRLHKSQAEGGRCKGEEKPGTQHPHKVAEAASSRGADTHTRVAVNGHGGARARLRVGHRVANALF